MTNFTSTVELKKIRLISFALAMQTHVKASKTNASLDKNDELRLVQDGESVYLLKALTMKNMIGRTLFLWLCIVLISATGCASDAYFKYFDSYEQIKNYEQGLGSTEVAVSGSLYDLYFVGKESDNLYRCSAYKVEDGMVSVATMWSSSIKLLTLIGGSQVYDALDHDSYPNLPIDEPALRERAKNVDVEFEKSFSGAESKVVNANDFTRASDIINWKEYTNGDLDNPDYFYARTIYAVNDKPGGHIVLTIAYSIRNAP